MQTQLSLRRYLGVGRAPRLVLIGLLILALTAGGILVGSQLLRRPSLPPPFGPADNGLLAVNIDGAIVLVQPDGSNIRPLALPFSGVSGTSFSRDGTRFAAWATPDAARVAEKSLIVANADGSTALEIGTATYLGDASPIAWSPDDRFVAFSDGADRVFVVDIVAGSAREIAPDGAIASRRDPAWAPDGRLAYRCRSAGGVLHLCVATADLATERILVTSPGTEWAFQRSSWSNDGSQIAYYVDDAIDPPPSDPGFDVAIIDVATGTERILTRGFVPDTIMPIWTPDDRHVLFGTESGPGVVRPDGTGLHLVAHQGCLWTDPSPDGLSLACLTGDQVVLYPIAGGPPTVIELGGTHESVDWQRLGH